MSHFICNTKVHLGTGVFVKILEPSGMVQITKEEEGEVTDIVTLDPMTTNNLYKFLERTK